MSDRLSRNISDVGVLFTLTVGSSAQPPETWARHVLPSAADRTALPVLLGLLEAETAQVSSDGLLVPFEAVADLDSGDLSRLGLPPPVPWTVRIQGKGLVTDRDFSISHTFVWTERQQPVVGATRRGAFVDVGGDSFTILDPLFSLVEKAGEINRLVYSEEASNEDRLLAWGEMRELLPPEAIVDGMLAELEVVRADSFSLSPFVSEDGSIDFDLVPMINQPRVPDRQPEPPDFEKEENSPVVSLSPADLEDFQNRFRNRSRVVRSTPLSSRTVLVLSPRAHLAFQTARDIQLGGSKEEKRAFSAQPYAVLREHFPEFDDQDIDQVFVETQDFSDRVQGIGLWKPAVLPFLTASGVEWLPPEEVGIRVGGVDLGGSLKQIERVEAAIRKAIDAGESTVEIDGHQIAATPEALNELERVRQEIDGRGEERVREGTGGAETEVGDTTALMIDDNIEDGLFKRPKRRRDGVVAIPEGVRTRLMSHQRSGLEWLQKHWLEGTSGALLADDMGLGKTLQSLAFLAWVLEQADTHAGRQRRGPMLVVAPSGLLKNWADEADLHLDGSALGLPCEAYGRGLGALRDPRNAPSGNELNGPHGLPVLDVDRLARQTWVLTTFETLRDYQFSFARVPWSVVVFDEAQKIKNPSALMTVAAKALNSDFTITMTGTPVENRTADLWCIADTCQPGRLGVLSEFVRKYDESNVDNLRQLNASLLQSGDSGPALLLRRMKKDRIEGLPEKKELVVDVAMPASQAAAYSDAVESAREASGNKGAMLQAIQRFRSISLHPGINDGSGSDEEVVSRSARLSETVRILDDIHARGEKALIFLESLDLQPVLAAILQRRYDLATLPLIINGSVNGDTRKRRVDKFQSRPRFDAMLLSPKAGGVGLTLTAANHVIHLSRWWNPAVENQSTDRVYRIGQEKPVTVYVPRAIHPELGERSFDVQLHNLLERKKALFDELMLPAAVKDTDYDDLFHATVG